jgi:hypothetical protein
VQKQQLPIPQGRMELIQKIAVNRCSDIEFRKLHVLATKQDTNNTSAHPPLSSPLIQHELWLQHLPTRTINEFSNLTEWEIKNSFGTFITAKNRTFQ